MHLSNQTLGLISLKAQETARPWVMALGIRQLVKSSSTRPFRARLLRSGGSCPAAALPNASLGRRSDTAGIIYSYLLLVHIVNTRGAHPYRHPHRLPVEIANLGLTPGTSNPPNPSCPSRLGPFHRWPGFLVSASAPGTAERFLPSCFSTYSSPWAHSLALPKWEWRLPPDARLDPAWFKQMKSLGLPRAACAALRAHLREWIGYYWLALVLSSFVVRKFVISGTTTNASPSRILGISPSQAPIGLSGIGGQSQSRATA